MSRSKVTSHNQACYLKFCSGMCAQADVQTVTWSPCRTLLHICWRPSQMEQTRVHHLCHVISAAVDTGVETVQRCSSLWRNWTELSVWLKKKHAGENERDHETFLLAARRYLVQSQANAVIQQGLTNNMKEQRACANTSRVIMNKECLPERYQVLQ